MKESKYVRKLLIASAVLVLGIPAIASATPLINDEGEPVVRVSYADLNLENEESVRVLYRRLQRASREVCNVTSLHVIRSVGFHRETRQCYRESLSNAVDKFDNEDLTRIHAG